MFTSKTSKLKVITKIRSHPEPVGTPNFIFIALVRGLEQCCEVLLTGHFERLQLVHRPAVVQQQLKFCECQKLY